MRKQVVLIFDLFISYNFKFINLNKMFKKRVVKKSLLDLDEITQKQPSL